MIGPHQLVNGIWMGLVLIFLGLVPGVLQSIAEAIAHAAARVSPVSLVPARTKAEIRQPRWFALAGAGLIAATVFLYCVK